jgi:hypothetical protein
MRMNIIDIDFLGAMVAIVFFISAIMVFALRLMKKTSISYWIGIFEFILGIPMIYLLLKAPEFSRPVLYYIQIGFILMWLVIELLLDYIFRINFRKVRWMVIGYVTLFFTGTGGMLGIAAYAGRGWSIVSIILFLIMAVLAFVQRKATGM